MLFVDWYQYLYVCDRKQAGLALQAALEPIVIHFFFNLNYIALFKT